MSNNTNIPGFRQVPQTGVIYVTQRAIDKGFTDGSKEWSNLGQGAPETGHLEGMSSRIESVNIDISMHEYSPVAGQKQLRQKVADLYNSLYRKGKKSQYTWENVCISGGGRIGLTRIAASLGDVNMGHFLPDYTAYEELLGIFKSFMPIPIHLDENLGYKIPLEELKKLIVNYGLRAMLLSNPCNPTGQLISGDLLKQWLELARESECSLILDEFYSHYIYSDQHKLVSAAEYVEDVNKDPVIILDGVTKNWRYPGWRISWTLAPREVIDTISSAGSFLDGGAGHFVQQEVLQLLEPENVLKESKILQQHFKEKREYTVSRLRSMGIIVDVEPQGTFYVWADLSQLPEAIADGFGFFEAALDEKVIIVPGEFFDINPDKRRLRRGFNKHVRISFGPSMEELKRGLDGLERVIKLSQDKTYCK
jgi:aspartate/methionine/tyrosine aminotransferase